MSNNPIHARPDFTDGFQEVGESWDLPKLYDDLADVQRRALDDIQKAYLRGLLHSGSRSQLAQDLGANPEDLREYLQDHLYPIIGKLVGDPEVVSSKIPEWLTVKGYSKTQSGSSPVSTSTSESKPKSEHHPLPKRLILGVGGVLLAIVTGVITEALASCMINGSGLFLCMKCLITENCQDKPSKPPSEFKDVSVPAGTFTYGGSTTWASIRLQVDPEIKAAHPQFQLRYVNPIAGDPGSTRGIEMLLDNQLSFAQSSRPITDAEYDRAKTKGFALEEVPVAIDSLAIAVHPSLAEIPGLTISQLQDIYLGKITNWQALGGPDLVLTPYSRSPESGGTVEFFLDNVLGGQAFSPQVQIVHDTTAALRAISEDPGGIYYASATQVVPQCTVRPLPLGRVSNQFVPPYRLPYVPPEACPSQRNQLNQEAFKNGDYPITRLLFVVIKLNGQGDEQAGRAYANLALTHEGQSLIEQTGFIPIR